MKRLKITGANGEIVYVNKYAIEAITLNRKLDHFSIRVVPGKVIIGFVIEKTQVRGSKEFKDLGPGA